jgi:hypothetical protein
MLVPSLRQLRASSGDEPSRDAIPAVDLSFDDYAEWVTSGDVTFPIGPAAVFGPSGERNLTEIDDSFQTHSVIYKTNSTVFSCMLLRQSIFAEITFRFQSLSNGKGGKLFGSPALGMLEHAVAERHDG